MSLPGTLGFGAERITAQGNSVAGLVTNVRTCWWLKIKTKPVRLHPLDGAAFPHIVHFTYIVNERKYKGSRYVSWKKVCPQINETILVFYDQETPSKYAVMI